MKTKVYPINHLTAQERAAIARAIEQGAVAALATDTVYGLAANAFKEEAIARIYALKNRPAKIPLQILIDSARSARRLVQWNEAVERLSEKFWPGALTLILNPTQSGQPLLRGFTGLGLRVPNHAGLLALLAELQVPLACTSANAHGMPVITTEEDLFAFCNGKVDFILTDGTLSPVASSVVDLTGLSGTPRTWREKWNAWWKKPAVRAVLLREGAISRAELESVLQEPLK